MHDQLLPQRALFFFNDTASTEIYTLSLHDALPIYRSGSARRPDRRCRGEQPAPSRWLPGLGLGREGGSLRAEDRKSTRLNSSHANISYAVFCLKKKNSVTTRDSFVP